MLPNTYWQLEYIEATGTQYIDTGINQEQIINLKVKGEVEWKQVGGDISILGIAADSSSRRYFIYSYNSKWYFGVGSSIDTGVTVIPHKKYKIEVQIKSGDSYLKVNNQVLLNRSDTLTTYNSRSLPLFALNYNGNVGYFPKARIHGIFEIYDTSSGNLIRKFIPAMRKTDYEIGLYDDVNGIFYTNLGTGKFLCGGILDAPKNIDLPSNRNPLSFIINNEVSVSAYFYKPYLITLNYDNSLGNATFQWNKRNGVLFIQLSAQPNSNVQFKGWYINSNLISTNPNTSYTPSEDTTIEARFEPIYEITEIIEGNGFLEITRGTIDKNDIQISVLPNPNNHFIKYEITGLELVESTLLIQNGNILTTETGVEINAVTATSTAEFTETPLHFRIVRNITVKAYFEEDDRFHLTVSTNIKEASVYISDNDVFEGTPITLWARPFPDYYFVKWSDEVNDNPRTIVMGASNLTLTAIYQRVTDTNGIYQYRCYVKDQLDMTALPKAFLKVTKFTIKTDLMTNANSTIHVLEEPENLNNGDVLVLYDPKGQFLYNGVIKSIDDKKITCSQMQSFYKGLWIYNVSPQDFLEHEIAVLLQDYADGKVYGCNYIDPLIAQRLGGITIDYVGLTTAKLPTDLDDQGNLNYTEKDMESFIYELYENYGIIFDFEINPSGPNYVHIKVPSYDPVKVGDNIFAIKDMSPITTIEETNKLIIYSSDKVYKTTYIATKSEIIEAPTTIVDRFDITKTKVVFSDDDISDLVANNLPSQMYNHRLTFTLLIKNFVYQFGDFNLGGQLDIYHGSDYYNSVLTGYEIQKKENQNITEVNFVCGKVRQKLTQLLTLGKV